jgi:hypothetical protein
MEPQAGVRHLHTQAFGRLGVDLNTDQPSAGGHSTHSATTTISHSTMQLLSSGLRAQFGRALHRPPGLPGGPPTNNSRSIHMPSWAPRAPLRSSGESAGTFVRQARTLLSRLVGDFATPGVFNHASHSSHTAGPSYSANPFRMQPIQQRFNGPTRFTLSRPLGAPFLPRAPAIPRNVTHVGLGTARNFSSARPLFQNIAENVPIAGRAFWEADWEIKLQKEREMMRPKKYSPKKEKGQPRLRGLQEVRPVVLVVPSTDDELEHFFPTSVVENITTVLLIPLAPTPTSRLPLPTNPSMHTSNHPLIPLSYLASVHDNYATHSLRVSTLFARLDAARTFEDPGVTCSAFGHSSGICTILEVKFAGWTETRVRGVLGEAGTGWCVLEEIHENDNAVMDEVLSEMSFDTRSNSPHPGRDVDIDPSTSFFLPTLDFSASFPVETLPWDGTTPPLQGTTSTAMSDIEFHNAWSSLDASLAFEPDALSDISESDSLESASSWGDAFTSLPSRRSSVNEWTPLSFSSTFTSRVRDVDVNEEPREYLF